MNSAFLILHNRGLTKIPLIRRSHDSKPTSLGLFTTETLPGSITSLFVLVAGEPGGHATKHL